MKIVHSAARLARLHSGPENFQESRQKTREIAFFGRFKLPPSFKIAKMGFGQNIFSQN